MQITELTVTMWPRLHRDVGAAPAPPPPPASQVAALDVLDADRDGWLDEDDLPYDQLLLLQRDRADAAKPAPPPDAPAAADRAPPAVARPAVAAPVAHIDVTPPAPAEAPPLIDLLA